MHKAKTPYQTEINLWQTVCYYRNVKETLRKLGFKTGDQTHINA